MSIQKKYINKIDAINYPVLPKEYRKYPTMNLDDAYEKGWSDLQELLSNQIEENVVEVVRCKDCKYGDMGTDEIGRQFYKCIGIHYGSVSPTDYCSYGERKDG